MKPARFASFFPVQKIHTPTQGGFDPGPAPDGPTKLTNWPSTQPCWAPAREIFNFQTGAGD